MTLNCKPLPENAAQQAVRQAIERRAAGQEAEVIDNTATTTSGGAMMADPEEPRCWTSVD